MLNKSLNLEISQDHPWSPLQLPNIYQYILWQFWKGSKVPAAPLPWQMAISRGREKIREEHGPEINSLLETEDLTLLLLLNPLCLSSCSAVAYLDWTSRSLCSAWCLALPPQSPYALIASHVIYRKQAPFLASTKKYGATSGHNTVMQLPGIVAWRRDGSCAQTSRPWQTISIIWVLTFYCL